MSKTVCIIGAGPSGLAAAKSLIRDAPVALFRVTVFEAQPRIGGLWPASRADDAGLVHPLMLANQSRHTVQFSDLAWEDEAPQFPRAWQVGRYLERYRARFCDGPDVDVRLGCRVSSVEPLKSGEAGWKVTIQKEGVDEDAGVFDYLVVASGYFGSPLIPEGLRSPPPGEVPVIHSSKYRDLPSLLAAPEGKSRIGGGSGGKILVVGGQFSGVEIAATIANHLSSAVNSPDPSPVPNPEKYTVHHLIQKPSWVFPLFTSPKASEAAAPFLPLDMPSYNLANRPRPLRDTQGHISVEAASLTHSIYQGVLGTTDQSEFGSPGVTITTSMQHDPPYLAVSDTYLEHVRAGLITVSKGKLSCLSKGGTSAVVVGGAASVESDTAAESEGPVITDVIPDIAAVVLATGFTASTSLSFFPPVVKEALSFSPDDTHNTVALAFHGTYHTEIANLGFVGFYRSPYWGVMEMQARFVAALFAASAADNRLPPAMEMALDRDESIERTLALRADPRASQFPMGDYAFLMQEFADVLGLQLSPPAPQGLPPLPPLPHNKLPMDILTPARYSPTSQAAHSVRQAYDVALAGLTRGRFVARAVFRSLQGAWSLERTLTSRLPSHPSGHFSGTATFHLREATPDGNKSPAPGGGADSADPGLEYLYIEDGTFTAAPSSGLAPGAPPLSFRATRRYVYRYDEARDVLSVWFARTDDARRADYLFHEVEFVIPAVDEDDNDTPDKAGVTEGEKEKGPQMQSGKDGWEAKAGHLCAEDFYDVRYNFAFAAVNLREWRVGYAVRGPKKDYTIEGVYRRPGA